MSKEAMKLALEAAYLAGWNASGEGYNAEYPFGDHARNPEEDATWVKGRDEALLEVLAEQPAPMSQPNRVVAYSAASKLRELGYEWVDDAWRHLDELAEQPAPMKGWKLVPLRMTQAMRDVTDTDGWEWPELLAAAEAITEDEYAELNAAPQPAQQGPEADSQERIKFEQFWIAELGESDELTYSALGYAIRRVDTAWEAWKARGISASQQTIMGRKVWIDWKTQALELRELVRLGGIKIAELEAELAEQPAQRTWVGLSDEDFQAICKNFRITHGGWIDMLALGIEAKLKEKNT